jgi:hypothetical protein
MGTKNKRKFPVPTPCEAPGCTNPADHDGRGGKLCHTHYQRLIRRGTLVASVPTDLSKRPEYRCWVNMKSRCNNPKATNFAHYGGRGISVCDKWARSFEAFLADVGPRPSAAHTLDRIDVDGNYDPANVRWATQTLQMRNLRTNKIVEAFGDRMTLAEAVERSGLTYNTVLYRIRRGWTVSQALSLPLQKGVRP